MQLDTDRYYSNSLFFKNYFVGLYGKFKILIFCCAVFLTHSLLSCNCHSIVLIGFSVPSERMNRCFFVIKMMIQQVHILFVESQIHCHNTNQFDTYMMERVPFHRKRERERERERSVLQSSSNKVSVLKKTGIASWFRDMKFISVKYLMRAYFVDVIAIHICSNKPK